jgi:RNA polymerase sigma factor for flagellar operon FliA
MRSGLKKKTGIRQYRRFERDDRKRDRIDRNLHLVRREAERIYHHIARKVPIEDLLGGGTIGLIKAAESFRETEGASFRVYARKKIRGAIIDELRKMDILPRGVRRRKQAIERAGVQLAAKLGRVPNEEEIAGALRISVETFRRWELEGSLADLVERGGTVSASILPEPFVDSIGGSTEAEPIRERAVALRFVEEALAGLAEKERLVITLYYYEEMTMKEIGQTLRISESRVSQIHARVLSALRSKLRRIGVYVEQEGG